MEYQKLQEITKELYEENRALKEKYESPKDSKKSSKKNTDTIVD